MLKILLGFLAALLGAVFVFSGYTKLYPIEPFEYTFVDLGFINWQASPFVARILIGLEFLIGFLLIFNIYLHKVAYKLGIGVLLLFSVYLILLISLNGNKGNCGCFGSYIQMTPLEALVKNIIMLAIFFVLHKYYRGRVYNSFTKGLLIETALFLALCIAAYSGVLIWQEFQYMLNWQSYYLLIPAFAFGFLPFIVIIYFVQKLVLQKSKNTISPPLSDSDKPPQKLNNKKMPWLIALPIISSFAMPFILNPVQLDYSETYLNKPEENYELELDSLYNNARIIDPASKEFLSKKELSKGKHIIIFLSLTCPHCRIAANKIRIMHERNPHIPFYMVVNGDDENLKPFFAETHTENIPYCMLLGRNFVYLAGINLPVIYLLNNGIVEHEVNYMDLDQDEMEKWIIRKKE
ncbi:MAG: hypothetical protein SGJ10_02735 [Bacteroidota bacterium]|nr:hypothetical protein [Bacteroidota bacterium]